MQKKISELTDIELKALAYDHTIAIQNSQNSINLINQELIRRQQPVSKDEPSKE